MSHQRTSASFHQDREDAVREIVGSLVQDDEFMLLFRAAIRVEPANMAQLTERAEAFPIEDVGVAQGNSLSPLLGDVPA